MRPCAWRGAARGLPAPTRPPRVPVAQQGLPDDVPLDWLSVRSLMDHCMGRGNWRRATLPAYALEGLPKLDRERSARVRGALQERGIEENAFVAWYNSITRATWQESAAILATLDEIPPFVLQRALVRVGHGDAASAVRIAERCVPTYSVDNATRIVHLLMDKCLAERQWHVAAPMTRLVVQTAAAWLDRRNAQPQQADVLVQQCARYLLQAEHDVRVRNALLDLVRLAQTRLPASAAWIEAYIMDRAAPRPGRRVRRGADWVVDPTLIEALLEQGSNTAGLLDLGVRVAAVHRDTERANAWFARIEPEARPTAAFLRALATSPHSADVQAAWALFDAMCTGKEAQSARLADWMLMVRAAAGDSRIPAQHVLGLLQLYEGHAESAARGAARWHAPAAICKQLATSRVAHSSAMDGFLARGDLPRALGVWHAMLRRGIAPDVAALASVCKVHFRTGRAADALREVARWCHEGVVLQDGVGGWMPMAPEAPQDTPGTAVEAQATPHRVQATTYLANIVLEGLLHVGSFHTLFHVWRALGPALHVRPDVVSLDLVLRAAILDADSVAGEASSESPPLFHPYAAREYFRRTLHSQHPELAACTSALDAASKHWLVRGEQRLRRWERWLEQRVAKLFSSAPTTTAVDVPLEPTPVVLDARVFARYAMLLYTLRSVGGGTGIYEELFRIPAYMQALDLAPERSMLCLLYCAQDEVLPPGVASRQGQTPLDVALRQWLDEAEIPGEAEIGEWFRAQSMYHR